VIYGYFNHKHGLCFTFPHKISVKQLVSDCVELRRHSPEFSACLPLGYPVTGDCSRWMLVIFWWKPIYFGVFRWLPAHYLPVQD
jgi:hypothetical protein